MINNLLRTTLVLIMFFGFVALLIQPSDTHPSHAVVAGYDYKFVYKPLGQFDGETNCDERIIFLDSSLPAHRDRFRVVLLHELAHAATNCHDQYSQKELDQLIWDDEDRPSQIHAAIYDIGENLGNFLIKNPQLVPLFTNE